jgi:hypothetical protein
MFTALHVAQPLSSHAIFQKLLCIIVIQSWQRDQQHHDVCAMPVEFYATQRAVQSCFCSASHAELAGYMSDCCRPVHATGGSLMWQVLCHFLNVGL